MIQKQTMKYCCLPVRIRYEHILYNMIFLSADFETIEILLDFEKLKKYLFWGDYLFHDLFFSASAAIIFYEQPLLVIDIWPPPGNKAKNTHIVASARASKSASTYLNAGSHNYHKNIRTVPFTFYFPFI